MYLYNNDNIITGYIKQLLHSFNLPRCKVFKTEEEFLEYYGEQPSVFGIIKKYHDNSDYIVYKKKNEFIKSAPYSFNHSYLNITTKLPLFNGIYDSTCHIYLGDYLRFLRDYKNIDLMSLYNCFSGETLVDNDYKYLIIPVKHKTLYTIALESSACAYVLTYEKDLKEISKLFTAGVRSSQFLKPFPIKTSIGADTDILEGSHAGSIEYACFKEDSYKLVIRIPKEEPVILSVLEGDFTKTVPYFVPVQINYEDDLKKSYEEVDVNKTLNNLQLLSPSIKRKGTSYPFADRLLEYLTDMAILPGDKISKNIIDAKEKVLYKVGETPQKYINDTFTNIDRFRFLDAFSKTKKTFKNTYDLLGFVDKEIEECLDDERGVE